ncbi:SGNH/GDSL hydrolase family protein [Aliikangiella maris]|uniref:GDSL-type esterase/lipase family protein n=2 Tax=Aliikangiella maris TaxID=3162458 RepID=A0ABV2BNV0_9GAMM
MAIKILFFGDSITFGLKDKEKGGWIERIRSRFLNLSNPATLKENCEETFWYNLGVPSENTDGLRHRLANELQARVFKKEQPIVVFNYGINDAVIHKNKNWVPLEYFKRNLVEAIQLAQDANAKVLLMTMIPIADFVDNKINQYQQQISNQDLARYAELTLQIAQQSNCESLDLFQTFNEALKLLSADRSGNFSTDFLAGFYANDGIHPNDGGHQILADLIYPVLINLINDNLTNNVQLRY